MRDELSDAWKILLLKSKHKLTDYSTTRLEYFKDRRKAFLMLLLNLSACRNELRRLPSLQLLRGLAVLPAKPSIRNKRRRLKNVSGKDLTLKGVDLQDSQALEFKVKQLQEFTRNLKEQIKLADSNAKKLDTGKSPGATSEEDTRIADELFTRLNQPTSTKALSQSKKPNLSSLILSTESRLPKRLAPKEFEKRINDDSLLMSSLIDKSKQDWNAIIGRLYDTKERLQGIKMGTIKEWLLTNAKGLSYENIEKLDKMLLEVVSGDIKKFNNSMYECLFENLGNLHPPPCEEDQITTKMKHILERYDKSRDQAVENTKMTQYILNSCLKYSSKIGSHENMDYFLSKFDQDYGIKPNRRNLTTVLQFYTKQGSLKQAWGVFDTMKFLSQSHAPDVTAYNSVLHLCNKEKNYAKAIDLYEEMLDKNLKPSLQTINIMARTMATASSDNITAEGKADSLRLLGWKYIHTLESSFMRNKDETNYYFTLEAMMALTSSDGDVGLARALYFKYTTQKYKETVRHWQGKVDYQKAWRAALDPRLFNHLLLAYANFRSDKLPVLLGYEKGIELRRNIMNSVDYAGRYDYDDEIKVKLPMLPIADMNQTWQIMSESRALWQFNLEFGGCYDLREIPDGFDGTKLQELASDSKTSDEFTFNLLQLVSQWKVHFVNHLILNPKTVTTFLTIPVSNGDEKEFLLRLKEFTFQQHELKDRAEKLFESMKMIEGRAASNSGQSSITTAKTDDEDDNVRYFASLKHKILADAAIYELMMKAASAFKDVTLSGETWKKRGEFRKTATFQQMDAAQRVESDSKFAALMVQFLTGQGLFTDALAIVMSSQKYIDWKYPMVKELHRGLSNLEDSKSIIILLGIVNKDSSSRYMDDTS